MAKRPINGSSPGSEPGGEPRRRANGPHAHEAYAWVHDVTWPLHRCTCRQRTRMTYARMRTVSVLFQ